MDNSPVCPRPAVPQTKLPASVSIETLLNAGKLVQSRKKTVLDFEKFDIESGSWKNAMNVECEVECEKFSSGAFRDAFHVTIKQGEKWVLKKYNRKATETILNTLKSAVENHCRKQVQMHSVARHIASKFKRSAPSTFGQCFTYNRCTIQVLMASLLQSRNMFLVTSQSILITMECVLQFQRMPVRF